VRLSNVNHIRWKPNEAGKIVLNGGVVSVTLPDNAPSEMTLNACTRADKEKQQARQVQL